MKTVFLDTVGLIALLDVSDQWHELANGAHRLVKDEQSRFVTTSFVILECGNAASRRPYRQHIDQIMRQLRSDKALIVPTESDWELAWSTFENSHIGSAGIVDCVSFVVMQRLGITEAFTNDEHFRAAGFTTLF